MLHDSDKMSSFFSRKERATVMSTRKRLESICLFRKNFPLALFTSHAPGFAKGLPFKVVNPDFDAHL